MELRQRQRWSSEAEIELRQRQRWSYKTVRNGVQTEAEVEL